ncbi:fungal-specific transcription factor domain-containing protein [Xylaria sp. CBS 124048]|nr:fungal-specific transcription factor domain-containing protein [Xylaria sp. CBS 124048]
MDHFLRHRPNDISSADTMNPPVPVPVPSPLRAPDRHPANRRKARRGDDSSSSSSQKRRCVSTACIACRRRKSRCDGALPSCAACAGVYGTECIYDPNSDHRRKGVYREKIDSTKASNSTLQTLVEAILNAPEEDVLDLVNRIRTCNDLDAAARSIIDQTVIGEEASDGVQTQDDHNAEVSIMERDLVRKMGELRVENGIVRFFGGTSHLLHLDVFGPTKAELQTVTTSEVEFDPVTSWSEVTKDPDVVNHLLNMYFAWHYPYFTTLSRTLFYRDFLRGKQHVASQNMAHCSSLLVNAILALGCHFTDFTSAYAVAGDSRTKGDHFFGEAKHLIFDHDEYEKPQLTTVQALALMSVREAGCGREARGWIYSGMSFRMAQDIGLNMNLGGEHGLGALAEEEIDARRVTFWGCFLIDKCWSNYMGRLPQLPKNSYNVPKYDVFPDEDAAGWCPYTDTGFDESARQAARTRTIGLQLALLCEISSDLLLFFYHPTRIGQSSGKVAELKKLGEVHRRLEQWHKRLPVGLEAKDGQLPNVLLMHMFFHLQYIHLFRPFLRYTPKNSPLPLHVSPWRIYTANAGAISKLMRLYKKNYNLRQICNIAVYMLHSACTIHLLNLPERNARRDIIHGVKHLEEIAEDWRCGRRTLGIISALSRKWRVDLPDEAAQVLQRTDERWGMFNTSDIPSPESYPMTPLPDGSSPLQHGVESQGSPNYTAPLPPAPSDPAVAQPSMPPEVFADNAALSSNFQTHSPFAKQMMNNPAAIGNAIPVSLRCFDPATWQTPSFNDMMSHHPQPYPPFTFNDRVRESSHHMSARTTTQTQTTTATATTTTTQSSTSIADGQEWYVKGGMEWQVAFNTWNKFVTPEQPLFTFTSSVNLPTSTSGPTSTSTSTPATAPAPTLAPTDSIDPGQAIPAMDFKFNGLDLLFSPDAWTPSSVE